MGKKDCICCREGLQALEERLLKNDYIRLEDLQICDSCRARLLLSIEDAAIKESEGCDERES